MGHADQHLQVDVPDQQTARSLAFIIAYCGLQKQVAIRPEQPQLRLATTDGTVLQGHNTICRYIADQSSQAQVLLGSTTPEQAQISEWLAFRSAYDYTGEEQLHKIDSHLATRVYLCSNHATLADLVAFTTLHRPVTNFPKAQIDRFCNIVRYVDLLQHTADLTGIYPTIKVARPAFAMPPPPPVPVKEDKQKAAAAAAPADKLAGQPKATPLENATAQPQKQAPAKVPGAAGGAAPAPASLAADAAAPAGTSAAPIQAVSAKKEKAKDAKKPAKAEAADAEPTVALLDLRVGKILSIERHPNAESLYVEQVDLGEAQPRQVVSGLVKFVPIEAMQDRLVIVVANMKPAKMRDVISAGMVLCASNAAHDQVDPLIPPEAAAVGERIAFQGFNAGDGKPEQLNPKKKIFEKIAPYLHTGSDGIATYKDAVFQTAAGPVRASIIAGSIS